MELQKVIKKMKFSGGRILAPIGLCAWALVGCTGLQAEEPVTAVDAPPNTIEVKVFFEGNCPRYVDNAMVAMDAKSAKKLAWVAYDSATGDPKTDAEFNVYFDPFKGKTDASNNKGVVTSSPLDAAIPENVLFKYTILGTAQNLPADCQPLDPFFRIR